LESYSHDLLSGKAKHKIEISDIKTSTMASSSSPSFLERAQDFVAENKRAVLIGTAAAVVAAGGAAYYASSSRQRTVRRDVEKGEKKDKQKSKKKKGPARDDKGPILEERKTKVEDVEGE
jgi:import receptor subunit TOM70